MLDLESKERVMNALTHLISHQYEKADTSSEERTLTPQTSCIDSDIKFSVRKKLRSCN
jgi:hypothetical protein